MDYDVTGLFQILTRGKEIWVWSRIENFFFHTLSDTVFVWIQPHPLKLLLKLSQNNPIVFKTLLLGLSQNQYLGKEIYAPKSLDYVVCWIES